MMYDFVSDLKKEISKEQIITDADVIKKLIKSDKPLYIWGCGLYANYIYNALKKNNIKIEGVFVDLLNENLFFNDIKVLSIKEVEEKNITINVIRGNGNILAEAGLLKNKFINKIYNLFDFMNFDWHLKENYLDENRLILNQFYSVLSDQKSKNSFYDYVKSRLLNSCLYIQPHFDELMYFPDFIQIGQDEVFIDCGAYDGDTLKLFINKTNIWKKYIALEPSEIPYKKLNNYILENKINNVDVIKKGVWKSKGVLSFYEDGDVSHIIEGQSENSVTIEVDKLDNLNVNDATFIKMDLEGAELDALIGAENIIKNMRPKMAISIYHKQSHLTDIFKFINNFDLNYNFYFRIHTKVGTDAVLYAI